jgi:competence protein ComEC
MGYGIDGMIAVAKYVSAIDGAEGRIAAFSGAVLLIGTLALLLIALPATWLRLAGVPFALIAVGLMWNGPRHDVMIDAEADVVALRMADGKLAFHTNKSDRFTVESWLAAAGLPPKQARNLRQPFACDRNGCIGKLPDGALVAIPKNAAALLEDCGRAALVIANRDVPESCGSVVIDRQTLATTGAIALRRTANGWTAVPSRAPNADRPWFGRAKAPNANALARLNTMPQRQIIPLAPPAEISGETPTPEAPDDEPDQ